MTTRRFLLLFVLPTVGLLLVAVAPLVRGTKTLFLRDVFNTHLEMKWTQAQAMKQGYLPLVDPHRSGGQPHLGNPNTVPLYPTNVLYLVASPFWALNAHFWIHWLLAPFAMFWLARAWGLGREGAWAAGVCYAASGYFVSNLNLYNLVAGVTWSPALAAAMLHLTAGPARGTLLAATAVVWALLLLGGDPMTALAGLGIGVLAVFFRRGLRGARWGPCAAALGFGTLLAAPQWVDFLRILSFSFRGHWGYSATAATAASWNPVTAVEWLLPFLFGFPDLSFWGGRFFSGDLPLLHTLYPGVLALALVGASGRPRSRAAWWAWTLAALGIFLALGRFNPVFGLLGHLPGAAVLRLPVKFWLLVAVGGSVLCGLGIERLLSEDLGRRFRGVLGTLGLLYAGFWLILNLWPSGSRAWIGSLMPAALAGFAEPERLRWAGLSLLSFVLVGLYVLIWGRWVRKELALALLLGLHLVAQLFFPAFLRPVVPTDVLEPYLRPPALLEEVRPEALVVHGKAGSLFGPTRVTVQRYPDASARWLQRQVFEELYPVAGILAGRRYEFVISPEGLDSFLTRATAQAVQGLPDAARLRLLAASGVDLLLLDRELAGEAADQVELVGRRPTMGGEILVYELRHRADPVQFVGEVFRSEHLNAALERLTDPAFDARRAVVLAGSGPELRGSPGVVQVLSVGAESLEVRVKAPNAGALVVQRSFLPIYRAAVDGRPEAVKVANMHRMAVELPAGAHEVKLWVDRRPLGWAVAVAALAAAGLVGTAWRLRRLGALGSRRDGGGR
ncbi:MAG: hypothetical protein V3T81_00420 [Thermoanaerobaculia bacterium]